jgi:hypothetical protein
MVLDDILTSFGHQGTSPVLSDVPEASPFQVRHYPNPFNPSVKIDYNMPHRGQLSIRVYNVRGELVRTLLDNQIEAGPGAVVWDGTDTSGAMVASGVYFYETQVAGEVRVGKMALVR